MTGKNKYSYRAKISPAKIRQIVRLFAVDLDASQIAQLTNLNRNTVNRYLAALRERIARFCEAESPVKGKVEVDESYFGARRVRGIKRWIPFSDSLAASLRWACVIVKPPRQVPALRHSRAEEVANMPHPGYGCPARNEDVCCCSNQSNVSTLA